MVFYGKENAPFEDKPQAWVNGPVYPDVYQAYKGKTANMCDHLKASDFCECQPEEAMRELAAMLDGLDFELIESIILLYGSKSQNDLIFLTHSEKPWTEARDGLKPFERSNKELSLDTMYEYYKARHDRNRNKE